MKAEENRIKKDQNVKAGLLERIAADSDCMYLSDLRSSFFKRSCRLAVAVIPAADYSIKVWQDAFYYITGNKENFKNPEEAKQKLLTYL